MDDEWINGWIDGWMDGWMDGQIMDDACGLISSPPALDHQSVFLD